MAEDGKKIPIRRMILGELLKFDDPGKEQRLALITKTLAISKQNLNRYLKQFRKNGLIQRTQEQPYAIYQLTPKGRAVNYFLVQSQQGNKIEMWRYHNLIMGYPIRKWGSWKFKKDDLVPMNNWSYQIAVAENGAQAHVQDTALLKIYGPEVYGPDGEEGRITSVTKVSEAARWFIDKYGFELGAPKIVRKGEKELQNSEKLAKLLGRVKTGDFFVNASYGKECLEEKEDSYMLESITEMPRRLDHIERVLDRFGDTLEKYQKQLELHLEVEQRTLEVAEGTLQTQKETRTAITELRDSVRLISSDPHPANVPGYGQGANSGVSGPYDASPNTLKGFMKAQRVQVQFTQDVGAFTYRDGGEEHYVQEKLAGHRLHLPVETARRLVKDGSAEVVDDG